MKKLMVLVLSFSLISVLVFAGGRREVQQDQDEIVTLTIMAPWAEEELEGFKPVMERFEAENPDIRLEYRTGRPEDVATILQGQFAVGETTVDVVDTPWAWYIAEQARNGHIMDVSDLFQTDEFLDGAVDRVTVDGRLFGVPSVGGVTTPEYRKSFFARHNLPEPGSLTSWEDFLDLLKRIEQVEGVDAAIASGGGVGWPFTSVVETFILTFGGADMHRQLTNGEIAWTDQEVRSILANRLLPLLQQGHFGEPEEFQVAFEAMWNGRHGLFIGDSTDSLMVDDPTDRGVFLLPGQNATVFWYDFWFAPKYTRHPEETRRLLRFLATEGQVIQVEQGGRIGTYTGIPLNLYPAAEREVFQVIQNAEVVSDMDDTVGGRFQATMWDQLGLIWSDPSERTLDRVLVELQAALEDTLGR
jgi:multiple sugar transport system substrate-binding protein